MNKKTLYLFVGLLCLITSAGAQTVVEHKPSTYIDANKNLFQHVKLPVYVFVSTTPNKSDAVGLSKTHDLNAENKVEPCYLDGEGLHTIRHQDEIDNEVVKFFLYADGSAPVSKSEFKDAPRYKAAGVQYYGKGLTVDVATADKMSGVNKLYQSTNGAAFTEYKASLDFSKEQAHVLKYYAADNVGNMENVREYSFTVDVTAPVTVHRIDGLSDGNIISKRTKILLDKEDKVAGVKKTYYALDGGKERVYTGGALPTSVLADGEHTLTYYSVDNVQNKEEVKTFAFYLDKISPVTDTRIVGDQFKKGAATYVSGRTKVELSATDNKSGVKAIRYAINGKAYEDYTAQIPVPQKGGLQSFLYTSEDKMTNKGAGKVNVKSLKLYVDLKPPAVNHKYSGPQFRTRDTIFIRKDTDISLLATDNESGLQKIGYKIDAAGEVVYDQKFNVEKEGMHKVEYTGYDNVNNAQTKNFSFIVDNTGPIIYEHFSIQALRVEGGVSIYSPHVIVFLAATDALTGNKTIYYKINGGAKRIYNGNISKLARGKEYTIEVEAIDQLGNTSSKTFKFKTE